MTKQDPTQVLTAERVQETEAEAKRRLVRNPRDEQALLTCARVALWRGQPDEAEKRAAQVTSPGARTDVALVRATAATLRSDWKTARDLCTSLVSEPSARPEAWFVLGLSRMNLGDVPGARQAHEQAVKLAPQNTDFRFELGRALQALQQPRAAVHQFVESLRIKPQESRFLAAVAMLLHERGKRRMALRFIDAALKQTPGAPVLLELQRQIEATPKTPAAAAPPRDANEPLLQQATALIAQKRNRDARKLLLEAWNQGKRSVGLKLLEAEACKGLLPPDMTGAIKACEEAIALEPANWLPYNSLGLLLLGENKRHLPRVIELLEEARRRAPQQPEPTLNLALAYSQSKRVPEARELARATQAELPPGHPLQVPVQEFLAALDGMS